jgi:hypothetical protein
MTISAGQDYLAADVNPYEAPRAAILGVEADPRGVAIRQKVLLWSLGAQLGSVGPVFVISMLERQLRATTVLMMPASLLVVTLFFVFYAAWSVSVWSVWSLTNRLKGGWGFLFAIMTLLPVYGSPAAWLVNLRATWFLRSKGYEAGWFGARLDQFRKDSS